MSRKALTFLNIILTSTGFTYLYDRETFTKLKFWQFFNIITSALIVAGGIYFMVNNNDNLDAFAEAIAVNVTCLVITVELVCHMIYRDEIKEMVDEFILNDYAYKLPLVCYITKKGMIGPTSADLVNLLNESRVEVLRVFQICLITFSTACNSIGKIFDITPIILGLISPEIHYRELPLNIQFPWNEQKSPMYQITYVMHIYFNTYIACVFAAMSSLLTLLVGHLIRQLRIIRFILSHLDELASELSQPGSELWEWNCNVLLANCVRHYVGLKRYCHRLNIVIKPFLLCISFGSAFVLCFSMFLMATAEELLEPRNAAYLFLGLVAIFQLALFCALGQHLTNESERLHFSLAGGSWWLHGRRHRSNLRIFLIALQRPITMYIFGSIDLSYATLGNFLRSSMSYFTMLLSVTDQ